MQYLPLYFKYEQLLKNLIFKMATRFLPVAYGTFLHQSGVDGTILHSVL